MDDWKCREGSILQIPLYLQVHCYAQVFQKSSLPQCPSMSSSLTESHNRTFRQLLTEPLCHAIPGHVVIQIRSSDHQIIINLIPQTPLTPAYWRIYPTIILHLRLRQPVKTFTLPTNLESFPSRIPVISAIVAFFPKVQKPLFFHESIPIHTLARDSST